MLGFHRALYVDHRASVLDDDGLDTSAYRDFEAVLRDDVDGLLAQDRFLVLLAELSDEPCGYITGHVENAPRRVLSRRGIIEDWYVAPKARGRGVGHALMDALLSRFRGLGCEVAESRTWSRNQGARAVHERFGFAEAMVTYHKRL